MTKESELNKLEWKLNNECMSDQEYEAIQSQIEHLRMDNEEEEPIKREPEPIISKTKKQKRSIISILKEKYGKKPEKAATVEEIRQLRLEYFKARLERKIAQEKEGTPKKVPAWLKMIQSLNSSPSHTKTVRRSHSNKEKDDDIVKDLLGHDYKKSKSFDYKKAFYG